MAANGQFPSSELAAIPGGTANGGTAYVRKDLLPAVMGLQGAFEARWGRKLRPSGPNDGYRSYQAQVNVFLARYTPSWTGVGPFSDVRWWNGVRYIRIAGASAAVPGTSNHGWAKAIDWADIGYQQWDWMMAYAPVFGWKNPYWAWDDDPGNGSKEPWHWEGQIVPVTNWTQYLNEHDIVVPGLELPDPLEENENMPDAAEIAQAVWSYEYLGTPMHQRVTGASNRAIEAREVAQSVLDYLPLISNRALKGAQYGAKNTALVQALAEELAENTAVLDAILARAAAIEAQLEPTA